MELMARYEDNYFDLAIVDPPYGISKNMRGTRKMGRDMKGKTWNDDIPKRDYFRELFRVSKNQIIWGANYYCNYLPPSRNWIVWDKNQPESIGFSMHEIAYTSFNTTPKIYRKYPDQKERRYHPCQKPISLYTWILNEYAKQGNKILDTHLGSGTIALACHNLGYHLTACEIDKEYYKEAIKRLQKHRSQLRMF